MIGILFAFLSAIITGVSLFLQKISLNKISNWKQVLKSPKWLFGVFLALPAFYFFLLALKFERLIIIQPIGYTSLLVTITLEILVFKEKLRTNEILSIILFFIGSLFIIDAFCGIFNILCL